MSDVQTEDVGPPADLPDVTVESAAQWAEESTWDLWKVVITGDIVEWAARSGMNEDQDGVPQPWHAQARAEVFCKARSEEEAKAIALRDNPSYYNVDSVEQIDQ